MELSKDDVEHVAQLARIELTDSEKEKYSQELSAIIDYVSELDEAPTTDVETIEQIVNLKNITRDDKVKPSLANKEVLANAPQKEDGFIKTKKILE